MVSLCPLPFADDNVDVIMVVVMAEHCKHALMVVVLVGAEVFLQRLSVPAVVLSDTGLRVAAGIVLWGLASSFLA